MRIFLVCLLAATAPAGELYPILGPRFGLERGVPHRVFGERFALALARDRTLFRDAAGFDKAVAVALKNVEKLPTDYVELGEGFHLIQADDEHVLARLLLTKRIGALRVKGNHVAFAPARHLVFVTGSDDPQGLRLAARRVAKYSRVADAFSGIGLELVDGKWRPFDPQGGGKVMVSLRRYAAVSWSVDIGRQTTRIRRTLPEGTNVGLLELDAEGSVATWTQHEDALLPRADGIRFVGFRWPDGRKTVVTVPWERVMAVCPKLLRKDRRFYERYRTRSFPTDDEFKKMLAR